MILRKKQPGCQSGIAGQVTLEFTFGVCMLVLVAVGMIRVFHWSSTELGERRKRHEATLYNATTDNPEDQLRESFYVGDVIDATVDSNIFGP